MFSSKTMPSKNVIVFGATGAIGTSLIQTMSAKQPAWKIYAVSRSGGATSRLASMKLPNVEMIKGEVEKLEDAKRLAEEYDIDMVYCCVGFVQYEAKHWAEHWPVVIHNLLAVTSETRPLIFCDNLYAYGPGTNISTQHSIVPPSTKTKPGIRAMIRKDLQARMDTNPKSIAVVGGADFFGPYVTDKSFMGDTFVGSMVNGKRPTAVDTADAIHDFCYVHDFANALYVVSVSKDRAGYGRFWICPHAIHGKTMREIAKEVNPFVEKQQTCVAILPTFLIRTVGLFGGFPKEMIEMLPFWKNDYTVDDSEFIEFFGVKATPIEDAMRETVEFFKQQKAAKV